MTREKNVPHSLHTITARCGIATSFPHVQYNTVPYRCQVCPFGHVQPLRVQGIAPCVYPQFSRVLQLPPVIVPTFGLAFCNPRHVPAVRVQGYRNRRGMSLAVSEPCHASERDHTRPMVTAHAFRGGYDVSLRHVGSPVQCWTTFTVPIQGTSLHANAQARKYPGVHLDT